MKPVDPRLLGYARTTRAFLAGSVILGGAGAALVVAQASLIAEIVVRGFQQRAGLDELTGPLLLLALTAVGRGLVAWLTELTAHRSVARVKSTLRRRLVDHATALGPAYLAGRRTGELTTLATRGVDALDDYFARYLPQLALAVVVPVVVLLRIVGADWTSAAIIAGTLPLIPLFMALIGMATQARMDRQWAGLSRLSHHFLDVVAGLPTLKVFNRAKAQAETIGRITAEYRRATLRTLRIAFISSFALELLSTLSVALVAVSIGFRLVDGTLDLETGLLILILAPEVYFPIRQVGALYHSSVEGLTAADEIFQVLETPLPATGTIPAPALAGATLTVTGLTVTHPGRTAPALQDAALTLTPGSTTALTGPSGAGKSTLLSVLLGLTTPDAGTVTVTTPDGTAHRLADLDPTTWRRQIAWIPQHPHLFAGTIADNVRLTTPAATDEDVRTALAAAHALDFTTRLPQGIHTLLGEGGTGLSAGQRQRLALARALLATDRPLVLLDEPTANLDGESEAAVVAAVRTLAEDPTRTVLLIAHRPALLAVADHHTHLNTPLSPTTPTTPLSPTAPTTPLSPTTLPIPHPHPHPLPPTEGALREGAADGVGTEGGVVRDYRTANGEDPAHEGRQSDNRAAPRSAHPGSRPRNHPPESNHRPSPTRSAPRLTAATTLGTAALLSAVALMATSGYLISYASEMPPVLYLMMAVTAVRAFGIGRSVFRYAERLVSHDAVLRTLGTLRTAVYARLEQLAPAGLPAFRRGDLLSRLVADVDAIQDHYLRWRLPVSIAAAVSVVSAVGLGLFLPAAGAVLALGLLLAGAVVPALAARLSGRTERRQAPARGELANTVVDTFTGTAELTVAGALPRRLAAVRAADADLTALAGRSAATTALGAGLVALLTGLTLTAAAAAGLRGVASGALAPVCLAVVVLTPLAAFEAVAGMPLAVQARERSRAARARLADVLESPLPVAEPAAPAPLPAQPLPIAVRGLSARYPGGERDALSDVSLTLAAGRRIAVVGPSGSGKSTLALTLLRFLDRTAGTVTLADGCPQAVDSALTASDDVRRVIGLCAQDAHVFDSSLRENLRLARPGATDEELCAALASARLLDWVETLPAGLDTMVGEHGGRLSGGQRQRLALARALLADFPVLVLDEPAEHLDLPTADALTADLLAATAGRTTLLITHRLAGLAAPGAVDEILVLDGGRVVERGGWADLTADPGSRLHAMWQREQEADGLLLLDAH
ncbi:ABC transporter [Kitasatospora herbaricolor]|uniref:thiol reductant ABC exporter subunit CydD n=1 Tax=Kitasatospora herbaricolor TaxID=68217 RepID=UPI00174AE642|nr:thiol reductant ABC exporter subunit CydD [Kitasatospora herbaricolor]MDQ0309753.1 ATP-binding cassette subfamily C protein CydCD [Kitasatospora herbaricolor]GGU99827.1 ABC transporter [Kitasatospora herbaricolor]